MRTSKNAPLSSLDRYLGGGDALRCQNAGVVCPVIGSLIEKVAAPGLAFVWTVLDSDDMDGTSEEDLLLANTLRAMSKGNPMPRFAL